MWFGILGAMEVRHTDGGLVSVGGPRVRSLLALLLLNAGRMVTAETLIDGLYGERPPEGAANALQSQVSRLRRGLRDAAGGGDLVELAPAGYRLAIDPHDVDVHRFERLAEEGRHALAAGDHVQAAGLLREALALWRGPALADVADAPFAETQAVRLEELRLAAIEDRVEAELALGEHRARALVAELQGLTAAHPLRERLRAQLMLALYASGRQAEALAVYQDAKRMLADELGADPSPELSAAHLAVLRAEPTPLPAPPARTPAPRWSGPPAQLTSFVGREDELARIGKQLATSRLVTLLGPGGAGKTRLAIEASAGADAEVCFVDLAPVTDGAEVPQAMLAALGLREGGLLPSAPGPPPDPTDRLVAALTDRRALVILDNCEHVVADAARLAHRLLGACPELRVLATSREALGITGESLHPVPPLALPAPGTAPLEALGYPAVRLFADRAAAVRPDFQVDTGNAETVLRICAALDGQPLAIELAAARLRSLTVADVAARLDDRFRLLSRGDRTKAPRHQTLRAVVEWSWDLLDEPEKVLARRLTVFSGGALPEAVRRVCGLPDDEVDDLLADLTDKSLVECANGRYRMLDTIRVFCAERLAEAGEEERLREAHLAYFQELARTAEPHLLRAEQLEWLDRLAAEHADLNTALRRAVRADPVSALRLLAWLSTYWWLRGLRSEGTAPALELLEVFGTEPPPGLAQEYVFCVVSAMTSGQDLPLPLERAKSIMTALDAPPAQPFLLLMWALAVGPNGAEEPDVAHLKRQFAVEPWSDALFKIGLGMGRLFDGELAEAEREFDAGLAGFRRLGDRWGMMQVLDELAKLADWRGDRESSLALLAEAVTLAEQLGSLEDLAELLHRRADALVRYGDLDAARADYERAADLARRAGRPGSLSGAHRGLGEIARLRGDLAEARRLYELALTQSATGLFDGGERQGRILIALGRIAETEGDVDEARSRHRQALDLALDIQYMPVIAAASEAMAGAALLAGDGERAALLLGVGRALRGSSVPGDPDVARITERSRAQLGDTAYASAFERGATMPRDEALAFLRG
ncbi:BTAD domain-containing putative transcriptional regulator [Actinomadura scrupuli]|uniref:BTAD domain-containing putative transcriptional regulator n=1 Tax=Actinomadura scrupuli TaxID=559629 RepID=UPI003D95BF1E